MLNKAEFYNIINFLCKESYIYPLDKEDYDNAWANYLKQIGNDICNTKIDSIPELVDKLIEIQNGGES